jgi:hypothetical protein
MIFLDFYGAIGDKESGIVYEDATSFIRGAENSAMIITEGEKDVERIKIDVLLAGIARLQIMYTGEKSKAEYIAPYADMYGPHPTFVDDDPLVLAEMAEKCPTFKLIEMRRDGAAGDGRFEVAHSFSDLHA